MLLCADTYFQGFNLPLAVTVAIAAAGTSTPPEACCFAQNITMWQAARAVLPDTATFIGATRVADCIAGILLLAHGLPLATLDGLLVIPAGCLQAVLSKVAPNEQLQNSARHPTGFTPTRAYEDGPRFVRVPADERHGWQHAESSFEATVAECAATMAAITELYDAMIATCERLAVYGAAANVLDRVEALVANSEELELMHQLIRLCMSGRAAVLYTRSSKVCVLRFCLGYHLCVT